MKNFLYFWGILSIGAIISLYILNVFYWVRTPSEGKIYVTSDISCLEREEIIEILGEEYSEGHYHLEVETEKLYTRSFFPGFFNISVGDTLDMKIE